MKKFTLHQNKKVKPIKVSKRAAKKLADQKTATLQDTIDLFARDDAKELASWADKLTA